VISTAEIERLYSGLSLLVSTASEGAPCAALASFSGLALLLDDELDSRARESEATPSLSWQGRETFSRSLLELRDTALGLDQLRIWACSASVETMALTEGAVEDRLAGVMSTPRFLREVEGATLIVI
jgi:peroxiredoxin family protein